MRRAEPRPPRATPTRAPPILHVQHAWKHALYILSPFSYYC